MWDCPKCKAENDDSLQLCHICGTSFDGKDYPFLKKVNVSESTTSDKKPIAVLIVFLISLVIFRLNYFYSSISFLFLVFAAILFFKTVEFLRSHHYSKDAILDKLNEKRFVIAGNCYWISLIMAMMIEQTIGFLFGFILLMNSRLFGTFVNFLFEPYFRIENNPLKDQDDNQLTDNPSSLTLNLSHAVGVPRRFSVGTLMILTALFAVLFSMLEVFGANSIIFFIFAAFFLGIGLCQMFLYNAKEPRKASIVGGFYLGLVIGLAAITVNTLMQKYMQNMSKDDYQNTRIIAYLFMLFGGPFGYLSGCLTAGIFLVREKEEKEAENEAGGDFV